MKRILLTVIATMAALAATANGPAAFCDRLAEPDGGASVEVHEHGDAAAAVTAAAVGAERATVRGYRVGIFYDNSQDARARAAEASELFASSFPDIPVYRDYRNPYFIVSVGNCLSTEEATVLWGRVKPLFPKAHITRTDIPIGDLVVKSE